MVPEVALAAMFFFGDESSRASEPTQPVRQNKIEQSAHTPKILIVHLFLLDTLPPLHSCIMPRQSRSIPSY